MCEAAKSDDVDKGDKKKKREYLKRFMSVRGMRVKPTEKKAVKVFGSSLSELLVEGDDNPVPRIVRSCVAYLQAVRCEEVEGIFRKSGNNNLLNTLKDKFKCPADEADLRPLCEDPHVVAVLLKQFLGSMSDPIVPCALYESFITQFGTSCLACKDENQLSAFGFLSISCVPWSALCNLCLCSKGWWRRCGTK